MAWVTPIIDRTQQDVDRALYLEKNFRNLTATELAEWGTDLKGALNTSDINRIVGNMRELETKFGLDLMTNSFSQIPVPNFWSTMTTHLQAIRDLGLVHSDTPEVPARPYNRYWKINDIEKILADAYEISNSGDYLRAGDDVYAGESIGLIL